MPGADRILTFVVRVMDSGTGNLRAVVERVRTGRKQQVQSVEGIGPVIAAMALEEDGAAPAAAEDSAARIDPGPTVQ